MSDPQTNPTARGHATPGASAHQAPDDGLTKRIAILSPSDGINDDEYQRFIPPGVTLLWTRFETERRDHGIDVDMVASYGDAALVERIASVMRITRPHVTAFCCNSCGFVLGPSGDQKIREAITRATGGIATSVTHAQVEAIKALKLSRVSIVAPYIEPLSLKLVNYLQACGVTTLACDSVGMETEWQIGNTPPEFWADRAVRVDRPDAEAVVLACSGIRIASVLGSLEQRIGKPVIAAPAAVIWHALQLAKVSHASPELGALFSDAFVRDRRQQTEPRGAL